MIRNTGSLSTFHPLLLSKGSALSHVYEKIASQINVPVIKPAIYKTDNNPSTLILLDSCCELFADYIDISLILKHTVGTVLNTPTQGGNATNPVRVGFVLSIDFSGRVARSHTTPVNSRENYGQYLVAVLKYPTALSTGALSTEHKEANHG